VAMGFIDRAQSGDYAEWPTWLPLAIDLVTRLEEIEPLRQAAAALARDGVPLTSPTVAAQAARLRAVLASRSGRAERAASHWLTAVEIASEAGMIFDAAALRLELFEQLPGHRGAAAGLRSALDAFTALRAAPWIERARAALHSEEAVSGVGSG
jgi:hypothetical protein